MHDKVRPASTAALLLPRPVCRRHGIIASLLAAILSRLFAVPNARLQRTGRNRRSERPLSDELRRVIGLPLESSRSAAWDDIHWK